MKSNGKATCILFGITRMQRAANGERLISSPSNGATIVYESTVYPGATEEVCIPILDKSSGMRWQRDFHVGYSPERINPGDKEHTLTRILKVVSGDSPETLEKVAALYQSIVTAGVFRASSI